MPKANKKAAIYCRVSTLHQIDKDSLPMLNIPGSRTPPVRRLETSIPE